MKQNVDHAIFDAVQDPNRKKSKNEVMKEIIAKSKMHKVCHGNIPLYHAHVSSVYGQNIA